MLTLDAGLRSELARNGAFRFDAVRAGAHHIELLTESLPDGAVITGSAERVVAITRDRTADRDDLSRRDRKASGSAQGLPATRGANTPAKGQRPAVTVPASKGAVPPTPSRPSADRTVFTIQVAALNDALRARTLVAGLKEAGFDAYLVEPPDANAPYRVRVGRYETREAARRAAPKVETSVGLKVWTTTATATER